MSATTDFVAAQRVNRRNTMLLLIVILGIVLGMAALVGIIVGGILLADAIWP